MWSCPGTDPGGRGTSWGATAGGGPPPRRGGAPSPVGCDGGRSLIRKAAGIDFPGWEATTSQLIAEVEMADEPALGLRPGGGGIDPVDRARGGGPYRVVVVEPHLDRGREPTLE